ncbi:MAG: hypothetical protein QOH09_3373 [Pseudonocardiales bacterium]|jgi:hypothetical protein|nr:hypothetical protein [Pseudonocardiales bacterium]
MSGQREAALRNIVASFNEDYPDDPQVRFEPVARSGLDAGRDDKDESRRPPRSDRDPVRRSEEEIVDPCDYYGGYGPDSILRTRDKQERPITLPGRAG